MHNAFAQQNSFDCGVWTCYAMYHRVLQRATEQEPANIFRDMNLKTPEDARRFRSLALARHVPPACTSRPHAVPCPRLVVLCSPHDSCTCPCRPMYKFVVQFGPMIISLCRRYGPMTSTLRLLQPILSCFRARRPTP